MDSNTENDQLALMREFIARPSMYLFSFNIDCATSFVGGVCCMCKDDVLNGFGDWISVKYFNSEPVSQHWGVIMKSIADKKFKNDEEKTLFFIQNLDEYLSQYY